MIEEYGEPPHKAALYVNSKSRRGEDGFDSAKERLLQLGIDLVDAQKFSSSGPFRNAVKGQIDAGTPLIVIGGGDGTLSQVAPMFARKPTVLGVLPLGTGNAFARDLEILNIEQGCDALIDGKVAQVDMGHIGDRTFLNVATIGLTAEIATGLNSHVKKVLGKAVYVFSIMRALGKIEPFLVKLDLPDGQFAFECLQLVIGNGRFHAGPFPVAPDATITGPFLSIYALATRNKSAFLKMALHMVNGSHVDLDEVRSFKARSGVLNTAPSQDIIVDGEQCFYTPQEFGMAERVLNVVVPQNFNP